MDDRSALRRIALIRSRIAAGGPAGLLQRVCRAATATLPVSGAGLSMMTADGARGISGASDPRSAHVEELQFVLGEGPCLDAFATRRPVLVPDLADGAPARWPVYTPAAREGGVRAVFAFPLQVGAARMGVLDLFRERAGELEPDDLSLALIFAEVAVTALIDEDVTPAVDHRAELFQAQGMVMVQLGVSIEEALVRMRARAYAEDRPVNDLARDVIARRVRFDPDPSGG